MFLKIIGSVCVITACSGYGFSKAVELKKHVKELEELQQIIEMFAMETRYSRLPISEIAERISKRVKKPYQEWLHNLGEALDGQSFQLLADIWEQEAVSVSHSLMLSVEEQIELKKLGVQLGQYNIEMQEQAFRRYAKYLEERKKTLVERISEKQRLCQSFGIFVGIFLVILLV